MKMLSRNLGKLLFTNVYTLSTAICLAGPFNIEGGIDVPDGQFPAVEQITSGGKTCVGTFISPTTLLTSNHCLKGASIALKSDLNIKSTEVFSIKSQDLALAKFAELKHSFTPIGPIFTEQNSVVTLIGFNKFSQKRLGFARAARLDRGKIITFRGEEVEATNPFNKLLEPFESVSLETQELGSPMFSNNKLIGIAVDGDEDYSEHVNVTKAKLLGFIKKFL